MNKTFGDTLKTMAVILGFAGVLGALALAIGIGSVMGFGFGFGVFLGMGIAVLIFSMMLYGFGELIENMVMMREEMKENLKQIRRTMEKCMENQPAAENNARSADCAQLEAATKPASSPAALENAEPAGADDSFLARAQAMNTAAEITAAFTAEYGSENNENIRQMLLRLDEIVAVERAYGNSKRSAISTMAAFFKHDGKIFPVNRSGETFACPACGKEQNSSRVSCQHCDALFSK